MKLQSYYEEREARRAAKNHLSRKQKCLNNNGWDDENYDYNVTKGEIINDRYCLKERIGKVSFTYRFLAYQSLFKFLQLRISQF